MSVAFGRRGCAGAILATALCLGTSAQADGIPAYVDGTGWHLLSEQAQHAVVVVHDDTEHLFLQIALQGDLKADQVSKLIWLTPIPAPASTVHVDILRGFPMFWGSDPVGYAKSTVRDGLLLMGASQIYTLSVLVLTITLGADHSESDVVVHERLVRDGVKVEVVSADSPQALAQHLKREEIELPRPALQSLGPYTGSSSCFTLVRIVDLAAYQAAVPSPFGRTPSTPLGVEVSFPTREGFFPLVASSALPGDNLRVVVTTPGFHEPTQPAPAGLITTHFVGHHGVSPEDAQRLGLPPGTSDQPYTRFSLQGPPSTLVHDLRFHPGAPLMTRLLAAWMNHAYHLLCAAALGLLVFLGLSTLAAVLARVAWPRPSRPSLKEAAWLGLANLLSLLGVLVAALRWARRSHVSRRSALAFTLAFSGIFCAQLILLALALAR